MADEGARLIATLEARVSKFEKDLAKANGTARREFGAIEKRGSEMASRLESSIASASTRAEARLGKLSSGFSAAVGTLKAGLAGFAAGAVGAFSLDGIKSSIADLAELQDVAEKTGASAGFLQELSFAVEQSGGSAADAAAGMQKFGINISKAAQGSGDLAKLFEANGVALTDAAGKMKPIEEQLRIVADLIKNCESEQDRLNLATAAFGRSAGPAMVLALAGGREGVADFAKEARKAGIVLGDDMVKQAAKLDDQIAKTTRQMDSLGKQMLLEAGPAIEAGLELGLAKLREFKELIENLRNMDFSKLGSFLFSRTGPGALLNAIGTPEGSDAELEGLTSKADELKARITALQKLPDAAPGRAPLGYLRGQLADVEKRIKAINEMKISPKVEQLQEINVEGSGKPTVMPGEGGAGGSNPFGSGDAIATYVRQVIKAESGGNANAKNPFGSAAGFGGFIKSTWLSLFKQVYPEQARSMGESAILALRSDADISKNMIEEYAKQNAAALRESGQAVTSANLHLAHFLGPGGAVKALQAPRNASASQVLGQDVVDSNRAVFKTGTVGDAIGYSERRANSARYAAGDRTDAEEQAIKQATAVKSVIDALTMEASQIGKTAQQAELLQQLQRAGVDINSAEGQAIADKVQQLYALKAAQDSAQKSSEALAQSQREWVDTARDATKGFINDIRAGASASEAFSNVLQKIADKLVDMAVNNLFSTLFPTTGTASAGGGGLFGGLFAGLFKARGGPVERGHPYIVGERRPELFVPNQSGRILPRVPSAPSVPAPRPAASMSGGQRQQSGSAHKIDINMVVSPSAEFDAQIESRVGKASDKFARSPAFRAHVAKANKTNRGHRIDR